MSEDRGPRRVDDELPSGVEGGSPASPRLVTPALLRSWPLPAPDGTKYSRGLALVVGGSCSTPGAAMLGGTSALRMGAGRLHLATAEGVATQVAVAVPECGTTGLPQDDEGAITGVDSGALLERELSRADALLVGPGLMDAEGAARLLREIVAVLPADTPVVLDAFAATVLPDVDAAVTSSLAGRLVLTPNPAELARLAGEDDLSDDDVVEAAIAVAHRFGAVVGCSTWVVAGGDVWQVTTGDTGLGTSGSGDVVVGAALGLLCRGAGLAQALVWAKYVHAAAGDVLMARFGRVGYLASEIPPELPLVLGSLRGD
ncbi:MULTISPECIES: NAD(P)H-hydrate dehydratase [unclassified Knoellia]|uniref:NAD(P)H-hydrate dehydratase n=1 Tax=Knoellia altitudinis TaxID=3404795 RepID=UPI00360C9505